MRLKLLDALTNRQIDALVASKAMGYEISVALQDGELDPILASGQPVPDFSTTMVAAWQMVQFVVQSKKSIALDYIASENQWRCLIHDEKFTVHRAVGITPEMAICKAVLRQAGILTEEPTNVQSCGRCSGIELP